MALPFQSGLKGELLLVACSRCIILAEMPRGIPSKAGDDVILGVR